MNSSLLLKKLRKDGWEVVRIKGSHHQLKHSTKKGTITVPHPKKDVPIGTLRAILKAAGLGEN
jgi:predicted RNA binding protein YcfA (HicA-like mRNA interferase family)